MIERKIVNRRVNELRDNILCLTQKDFAELLGKGRSTVNNWEQGTQIKSDDLERICRVTGASADYLLGLSEVWRRSESLQSIHAETGLSEEAIIKLVKINKGPDAERFLRVISLLIENSNAEFFLVLLSSLFDIDASSGPKTISVDINGEPLTMSTEGFLIEHIKTLFVQDILDIKTSIGKRRDGTGERS